MSLENVGLGLARDFRYAWRGLLRERGLTATAVLILAIGIGANTAVFSLIRPVLLKPLPFEDAGSLVWVANTGTSLSGATFQVATYEALSKQSTSFSEWTAYFAFFGYGVNSLTGLGDPERVSIVDVAPRFFEVLGVRPANGRLFLSEEYQPNAPGVVLVSHEFWTRRLGANPAVVGTALGLNDRPTLIAGVLPPTFNFSSIFTPGTRVDFVKPATLEPMKPWGNTMSLIARLKPGTSIESARAELETLAPAIRAATPELFRFGTRVTPLQEHVSGSMRRPLLVLWGAVGLVLLIVCANVSNLLLARSTARAKEFAVRLALGAGRGRIVQQLALEGVVLAGLGGALGIPLAYLLTTLVKQNVTLAIPLLSQVHVDGFALLVTAGVAIGTGLLFSILPGLRLARTDPQSALTDQSRGTTAGRQHAWVRSSLVVAEVVIACVLLVGTGLLLRSFVNLLDVDLGFRPAESTVLTLKVSRDRSTEQTVALFTEAAKRVRGLSAVQAAGLTDALPLDRNRTWGLGVPGQTYAPGQRPGGYTYIVGPGYLSAMGMTLVRGRDFADTDTVNTTPVLIVSESLARQLYPSEDALGRLAQVRGDRPHTIIGIVADVRQTSLDERGSSQLYLVYTQGGGFATDLVVRSSTPPSAYIGVVRQELASIDPTLVVTDIRPLAGLVDRSVSPRRFVVSLLTGFALFALLLASLGIYGVVSYGVNQRVQEIGVRMALGASGRDVRRQVLAGTLRLAVVGIAVGLAAALALGRVLGSLLFNTSATDLATFGWAALALLAVACAAGYLPALRASRIPPMQALQR
jgi:predicted permease